MGNCIQATFYNNLFIILLYSFSFCFYNSIIITLPHRGAGVFYFLLGLVNIPIPTDTFFILKSITKA